MEELAQTGDTLPASLRSKQQHPTSNIRWMVDSNECQNIGYLNDSNSTLSFIRFHWLGDVK
jgi:hypothetical protein